MNIDDTEGHSVRSTGFLTVFKRGCIRCGPVDSRAKKMGIKTGVTFWNLIFFMMVTCVRGKLSVSKSYSEVLHQCVYGWERAWSGCRERRHAGWFQIITIRKLLITGDVGNLK
uniref:Uncharacterized protein n=1 Tax=Sinocyclocheilus grahami TaxID=75366 RepID=A0A672KJQ9_SINGR